MKIITFIKHKKITVWLTTIISVLLLVICAAMVAVNLQEKINAKADRSNAMQVAKPMQSEQIVPVASPDFFIEYRLERDKIRSERSDLLRESIKNATSDDARQKAQDTMLKMVMEKQRETEIESLIKARGFADVLVFIKDNSVSAVVKTSVLSKEDVVQVAEIISRVAGVKAEDITISAKP